MTSEASPEPAESPCGRARRCPGWVVTSGAHVAPCEACGRLSREEAFQSARAAGLDVQRSGYVAGISGVGGDRLRSDAHRATVSVNDLLIGVLEQLMDAQRMVQLPAALRSSVDHLVIEVAKVQGVSEWVAEDLLRLVDEDEA